MLTIATPSGFSLAAAADYYAGFTPMGGSASRAATTLTLAFLLDGDFTPVQVTLEQHGDLLRVSNGSKGVERQLTRMLGLDADGAAWRGVGARDAKVAKLQQQFPGFFTAAFPSPWEAGVGGVLSQRTSIHHAKILRERLSKEHGTTFGSMVVLPGPSALLKVQSLQGVPEAKLKVLHGLARAALDGKLDAETLRSMPEEAALEQLQTIHGIGPWTAGHMLARGAATRDFVPVHEARIFKAFEHVYGKTDFGFASEVWKPFRSWVCVLLMRELQRSGKF